MLCDVWLVALYSGAGTVERGDALNHHFTRGTQPVAAAGRFCGRAGTPGPESIVRYLASFFQLIVFYAAGAALFFAVAKVR